MLAAARQHSHDSGLVFPSNSGRGVASWVLAKLISELSIDGTLHGGTSSFRDSCDESGVAREVAEACLAHRMGSAAELAYARSDLMARRCDLMDAWAST